MSMADQQKHDLLMEMRPDGAHHDEAACMFCTAKASEEENVADDQAIFTTEQHEQLVATAVQNALAEAQAELDAEILSLNERLEAASAALDEKDARIAELEKSIADREESERLAALQAERVEAVQAVVNFSDEQIEKRKESWATLSDEDFAAYLEDISSVAEAAKAAEEKGEELPKTEFDGTRATAGAEGTEESVITDFFSKGLNAAVQS
jgi:chromosome segregation ATPase